MIRAMISRGAVLIVCSAALLAAAGCGRLVVPADVNSPGPATGSGGQDTAQRRVDIPFGDAAFAAATAVTVGKGDTVYALSRRHGVPVRAIIEANGLRAPFHLRIGQRIVLPRPPTHVVAPGETLYAVARRYGGNVHEIARNNGLDAPYTIFPGQRLIVPSGMDPAPRKPAFASGTGVGQASARTVSAPRAPAPAPSPAAVQPPPERSGKGFLWPVEGPVLSSYGAKSKGLFNDGINIAAARGAPVRAADTGVVAYAGNELRGFGNLILIKHANGWVSAYAHLDKMAVKRGQTVARGAVIGTVGSTGGVTRPQLHFELRRGRRAVDPIGKLPKRSA
jgi:murein DD-endopeptidase MepM/ murein hydrolase activator NlpD